MLRRQFLTGLASLIAAPAVVRAGSLMPIVVWKPAFGFILHGGGMGAWVTCRKSELIGVDLGLPPGLDWGGKSDTWYWKPRQAPLQWEQATRELRARLDASGSTSRRIAALALATSPVGPQSE
jgi:hypothetical protein